jgi:hypothetical protein
MSFDVTFVTSKFGIWSSNVRQWVNLPPNRIGGLEHEWIICPFYIWDVIQTPLTKSMIFQDVHIAPPTRVSFSDLWSTSNHQVHLRGSSGIVARCYYSGGSGGQTTCLLAASCWPGSWWLVNRGPYPARAWVFNQHWRFKKHQMLIWGWFMRGKQGSVPIKRVLGCCKLL